MTAVPAARAPVSSSWVVVETVRLLRRRKTWVLLAATATVVVLFGFVLVAAIADLVNADPLGSAAARTEAGARVTELGLARLPTAVARVVPEVVPVTGLLAGTLRSRTTSGGGS